MKQKIDMNENLATVGLGRRVVKASSSMLPRSVPPLGKTIMVDGRNGDDDVGGDGGGDDEQGPEVKYNAFGDEDQTMLLT